MRLSAGPKGGKAISKCPADLVNKDDHENVEGISREDEDGPFFPMLWENLPTLCHLWTMLRPLCLGLPLFCLSCLSVCVLTSGSLTCALEAGPRGHLA